MSRALRLQEAHLPSQQNPTQANGTHPRLSEHLLLVKHELLLVLSQQLPDRLSERPAVELKTDAGKGLCDPT